MRMNNVEHPISIEGIVKFTVITALFVGSVVAWIAFITLCVRVAQMWGWL